MAEVALAQLRSLVVLAEEQHYGRASERLHLTQPALSHQIQRLETAVGTTLFDRVGRGVVLNAAGESLAADARRLLAELDRAIVTARRAGASGLPLHVSHSPSISRILLPDLTEALRRADPPIDVVWIERSDEVSGLELISGRYDVVLGRFPIEDPALSHLTLLWERPGVYVSADDPLAARDEVSLEALHGRRIHTIRPESAPRHYAAVRADLRAAGLTEDAEAVLSYGDWGSERMRAQILDGSCVVVGLASARDTLDGVAVVPLASPARAVPVTAVYRSGERRPEILRFLEVARDVAAAIEAPWRAAPPITDRPAAG